MDTILKILFVVGVIALFLGWGVWLILFSLIIWSVNKIYKKAEVKRLEEKRQEEQRKWQEEQKKRDEENRRIQNELARARAVSNIAELVSNAQIFAAKLPLSLSKAELCLDQAEDEFSEGLYSPFWEAMEKAAKHLSKFDQNLRAIEAAQQRHTIEAPPLAPDAVCFSLGVNVLPSPSATSQRMKALYRKAQKDPHFAQIYEQRRTNAILIEGFRSLGDALTLLGDRIESELRSLNDTVNFRLTDIETALRDSSKQMERQHAELIESAQAWREEERKGNAEMRQIARSNAEQAEKNARERREYEATTRDMLDNIQRRRKPLY